MKIRLGRIFGLLGVADEVRLKFVEVGILRSASTYVASP